MKIRSILIATSLIVVVSFISLKVIDNNSSARTLLPNYVKIRKTIVQYSWFQTFAIYELDAASAARIKTGGLAYLGSQPDKVIKSADTLKPRYIGWYETPMISATDALSEEAATDYQRQTTYPQQIVTTEIFMKHDLKQKSAIAFERLKDAARSKGSFFTISTDGECGILIDPNGRLALVICGER
jgi:hypothetical protein